MATLNLGVAPNWKLVAALGTLVFVWILSGLPLHRAQASSV
jgi:hypothetical protein